MADHDEARVVEIDGAPAALSLDWRRFLDKTTQSAFVIVFSKLIAAWVCIAVWSVPVQSRWLWGFIPYAGIRTTGQQFREMAAWSTASMAGTAVLWAALHLLRNRTLDGRLWGACAALPMAALAALFEWWRRIDASHLLPGYWLMWILLVVTAMSVLVIGFAETQTSSVRGTRRSADRQPAAAN